jgi:short-subunit dehydrogenase
MKTFIITGASDGIGAELARQLAQQHGPEAGLVLAARNERLLDEVAAVCRGHGSEVLVVPTDVGDAQQCRALVERSMERFGWLDALINNAGVSGHALFEHVQPDDLRWYEELMRVNLWGSVWCTHAALPHLKASKGQIVAVSSLAGLVGLPGRTAYCTSKFAMTGFFEALRAELKPAGVSVTTAFPGVVATQIRYRGYNAAGEAAGASGLKEDKAMPVDVCAHRILDGMARRQREVVMEPRARLARYLKLLAPGMVENMALAALKDEARPQ